MLLAEAYFVGIGNFVWLGSFLGTIWVNFFCHGSVSFQGGAGLAEVQGGEALVVVSSENFIK